MNKTGWSLLGALAVAGGTAYLSWHPLGAGSPRPASPSAALNLAPVVTPVEWKTYSDSELHLSIDSPFELRVTKPPVGEVKSVEMEGNDLWQKFYITLKAQELRGYEPDMARELDAQVKLLQSMNAFLRNLQVETHPVTLALATGLMAEGSCHVPGRTAWTIQFLKLRKDAILLDLLIQYEPTAEGKAAAERVLSSLGFNN
ncbi:MAG TPA: hypothetical protein VMV05_09625 [bacterium]|nr:hypothetical protein [bacterium]